jgi:hypothetical protein
VRDRDKITAALSAGLPEKLVSELLDTFVASVTKFNAGDYEGSLNKAGFFAEHALRAFIFHATGSIPDEIERFSDSVKFLAKAGVADESVSILMPRILSAVAYDLRSKRGAAHVKGVNPKKRDAALAIMSLSWVLAEMVAVFSDMSGQELDSVVASLMRRQLPLVESIGGQPVVTAKVPVFIECLLIIDGHPEGIGRREIGRLVKASPSSITHGLSKLSKERLAHSTGGLWFITGPGEGALNRYL